VPGRAVSTAQACWMQRAVEAALGTGGRAGWAGHLPFLKLVPCPGCALLSGTQALAPSDKEAVTYWCPPVASSGLHFGKEKDFNSNKGGEEKKPQYFLTWP